PQSVLSGRADAPRDRRSGRPARIAHLATEVSGDSAPAQPVDRSMAGHAEHRHPMSMLESVENAKLVLDQWTQSIADVMASMTDHRPEGKWRGGDGPVGEAVSAGGEAPLWWEQP